MFHEEVDVLHKKKKKNQPTITRYHDIYALCSSVFARRCCLLLIARVVSQPGSNDSNPCSRLGFLRSEKQCRRRRQCDRNSGKPNSLSCFYTVARTCVTFTRCDFPLSFCCSPFYLCLFSTLFSLSSTPPSVVCRTKRAMSSAGRSVSKIIVSSSFKLNGRFSWRLLPLAERTKSMIIVMKIVRTAIKKELIFNVNIGAFCILAY